MITKPQKFTGKFVLTELYDWFEIAKNDKDLYYIKECVTYKDYSYKSIKDAMDYLKETNCPQIPQIVAIYSRIKELTECRINKGALKGELNASISSMNLTNHHKWKVKTDTIVEHKGAVDLGGVFGDIKS